MTYCRNTQANHNATLCPRLILVKWIIIEWWHWKHYCKFILYTQLAVIENTQPTKQNTLYKSGLVDFYRLTRHSHPAVDDAVASYVTTYNRLTDADQALLIPKMWVYTKWIPCIATVITVYDTICSYKNGYIIYSDCIVCNQYYHAMLYNTANIMYLKYNYIYPASIFNCLLDVHVLLVFASLFCCRLHVLCAQVKSKWEWNHVHNYIGP